MANIIIVGCGRVGSQLATLLSQGDGNVCVVDRNAAAFSNLDRNFNGNTLQGVGFDEDVLVRAGVEEADVVAAVTQSDNSNLMVIEVARRIFHVPHVIARLYNPARERLSFFVLKVLILRLYRDSASLRPRCTIGRIIAWSIRLKGPV